MTTTNEHTERAELIKGLRDLAEIDFDNLFMRAAAMLEAQPMKPLTDEQISAVAVDADCVWLQKEYTCSFRAIVRATEAAHGIKDTP